METFEDLAAVRLREHEIDALIRDLEAATGPDRELDARIVAFLNNATVKPYPPATDFGPHDRWQFWSQDEKHFLGSEAKFPVPELTASLDDALSLVPEGWRRIDAIFLEGRDQFFTIENQAMARGNTAPLAVCIAVLKARKEPQ